MNALRFVGGIELTDSMFGLRHLDADSMHEATLVLGCEVKLGKGTPHEVFEPHRFFSLVQKGNGRSRTVVRRIGHNFGICAFSIPVRTFSGGRRHVRANVEVQQGRGNVRRDPARQGRSISTHGISVRCLVSLRDKRDAERRYRSHNG